MGVPHIIAAIIGIFVITMVFIPFILVISDNLKPALYTNTSASGQQAMNIVETMFLWSIPILIVGLILYMLATAHRREYDSTIDRPRY